MSMTPEDLLDLEPSTKIDGATPLITAIMLGSHLEDKMEYINAATKIIDKHKELAVDHVTPGNETALMWCVRGMEKTATPLLRSELANIAHKCIKYTQTGSELFHRGTGEDSLNSILLSLFMNKCGKPANRYYLHKLIIHIFEKITGSNDLSSKDMVAMLAWESDDTGPWDKTGMILIPEIEPYLETLMGKNWKKSLYPYVTK